MDQLNNTKRLSVLTTILLVCLGASCLAQEPPKDSTKKEWRDFFGSSISSRDCTPADDSENQGARICKGVEGYSFLLKGDDLKPEVYLITPNGRRYQVRYWNTNDPKYQELNSSVRWIVVNTPRKTITVTFTANIAPRQDYSVWGSSYDIIARVSPGPICVIGSVATAPSAIAESVAIASSPSGRRCLSLEQLEKRDWFATTRRLATEGQITAAKFAVTKVPNPHERFLLYREIASAQLKAGDLQGARRTLLSARDKALKTKSPHGLRFTLSYIVYGMAEAGLYDIAKSEIKRFPVEERVDVYLSVAYEQAEKGDLEAAKKTFAEAIQFELKQNPGVEYKLEEIGIKQARMGLVDEARKTASLIRDPDSRERIETKIREQRSRN